jgi:hypothetical protein
MRNYRLIKYIEYGFVSSYGNDLFSISYISKFSGEGGLSLLLATYPLSCTYISFVYGRNAPIAQYIHRRRVNSAKIKLFFAFKNHKN